MTIKYFQELSNLLLSTQADQNGKPLKFDEAIQWGVRELGKIKEKGKKVILIGNGGSAAIVSHAQNDICKTLKTKALVFNEAPLLTAYANDHGYETAFKSLIELWADEGDLLIAVSSSGKSPNIIAAVAQARKLKCQVITLSGFAESNPLRRLGDINFYIQNNQYGFVEVSHMAILHCLTDSTADQLRSK